MNSSSVRYVEVVVYWMQMATASNEVDEHVVIREHSYTQKLRHLLTSMSSAL